MSRTKLSYQTDFASAVDAIGYFYKLGFKTDWPACMTTGNRVMTDQYHQVTLVHEGMLHVTALITEKS